MISGAQRVFESRRSGNCPECHLPVAFESGWYHIPEEGRVVHDGGCWWKRLVRKGIVPTLA